MNLMADPTNRLIGNISVAADAGAVLQNRAEQDSFWADCALAAALFAIDPIGIGGVVLRSQAGPVRDRWLEITRTLLPPNSPWRRIPLHATDDRLLGSLDLTATLHAGRPVTARGLISELDGGIGLLASAERLSASTVAHLTSAMDRGEMRPERATRGESISSRFGLIALDEGLSGDEQPPGALLDRLGLHIDLAEIRLRSPLDTPCSYDELVTARGLYPEVKIGQKAVRALCETAMLLGIASLRAPLLALYVARANAALNGCSEVSEADTIVAGRLVLAPRATCLPSSEPETSPADDPIDDAEANNAPEPSSDDEPDETTTTDHSNENMVLSATEAAIPPGLLATLQLGGNRQRGTSAGKAGVAKISRKRGRPAGTRRSERLNGARLNVVETLRAAVPWQRLRQSTLAQRSSPKPQVDGPKGQQDKARRRIEVRRGDFRVTRFKERSETATIFAVDASGSSALHRLAEVKGAVELLLADCYMRRDQVALVAFRGQEAELLLSPTRSLVRAKRSLAGLPGGGGTPLAAGLYAALTLAETVRRKGVTPLVILLTDGRANVARDGTASRTQAEEDALSIARQFRSENYSGILVDTSPRAQPKAQRLASEMGVRYLPLPYANASTLSQAVRSSDLVAQR